MTALRIVHITASRGYAPGDPAPSDYLGWHEWARVQARAGLRQEPCGCCGLWCFPQQLSAQTIKTTLRDRYGRSVEKEYPVCLGCAAEREPTP